MQGRRIKTAIFGIGNCASSLVQGVAYCRQRGEDAVGVLFPDLGGYAPGDVDIVAAFDIDRRKVGKPLSEAIFSKPNNTMIFHPETGCGSVTVSPGAILDGVSASMRNQPADDSFLPIETGEATRDEVVAVLKCSGAQVAINFLPVGSIEATEFYAQCAIDAGMAFVNAIPVFIASSEKWARKFRDAGLPVLGDDFKAQMGATIVHRALVELFDLRGTALDRTYQLNVGGNTDFLNMTDQNRLLMKRESKTESVQSAALNRFADNDVRIGPSDYVSWLDDRKVAFIRLEGKLFGGAPINLELRLDVEDSPNAAIMAMAAIRCARIALDRNLAGAIPDASAFIFKHPPVQAKDHEAYRLIQAFAATAPENAG